MCSLNPSGREIPELFECNIGDGESGTLEAVHFGVFPCWNRAPYFPRHFTTPTNPRSLAQQSQAQSAGQHGMLISFNVKALTFKMLREVHSRRIIVQRMECLINSIA